MSDRRGYSRDGSRDSRQSGSSSYQRNSQSSQRGSYQSSHNSNWDSNTRNSGYNQQSSGHINKDDHCQQRGNTAIIRVSYDVVKLLSAQSNAKVSELQDKSGARIKVGVLKLFEMSRKINFSYLFDYRFFMKMTIGWMLVFSWPVNQNKSD